MASRRLVDLTPREREVLHCLAMGLSNQQIAAQLIISVATVQNHLHNIYDKLTVCNRTMAVVIAQRRGMLALKKIDDPIQARTDTRAYPDITSFSERERHTQHSLTIKPMIRSRARANS